jgi:hypothetical protein
VNSGYSLSYNLSLLTINLCYIESAVPARNASVCVHVCVLVVCKIEKSHRIIRGCLRTEGITSAKTGKLCKQIVGDEGYYLLVILFKLRYDV